MTPAQLQQAALSLPATTEEPHFNYSSFRVNGKIFSTVPPPAEDRVHTFVDAAAGLVEGRRVMPLPDSTRTDE